MEDPRSEKAEYTSWVHAILTVAQHYRLEFSEENIRIASRWGQQESAESVVRSMARQAGLVARFTEFDRTMLSPWRLPLVVQLRDGQVGVIETTDGKGHLSVSFSGDRGAPTRLNVESLVSHIISVVVLRPAHNVADARVDDYVKPPQKHWFRSIILRDLKPYGHVMIATTVANILALAGILFSKQVYDRVIPAESTPTLYVLFSGVLVAVLFDFLMRINRIRVTDLLGKRADIRVSDLVYGHAVRLRNSAKPKSTGAFISQIRELDRVREMVTSTTILAMADMPFFFLFFAFLWYVAGPLALIPLAALVLLIVPGLLAQRKLAQLAGESIRESSLRNAMLVETVQGMEDIKSMQAEQRFQQQWNHYNAVTAESNLRLRGLIGRLVTWTHNVQSSVFAFIVLFGAPMVMAGDMTTGSLVAASILGSRMMAPMSQITQVLSRWQQAKYALKGLDNIMQLPVDHAEGSKRVHLSSISGNYQLRQASFKYGADCEIPALSVEKLEIHAGEKIAILGRNGAGKSTLLQALSGMLEPASGEVILDGVSLAHIDPADVRRDIGLLTQNANLFHGTLRENVTLGAPGATDKEIIAALDMSGALEFIRKLPKGMDHVVLEGGLGLSGGQRQSLLLARLFIRNPSIVLLDEPTASLDDLTEKRFISKLEQWLVGRTLIIATHRTSTLKLADRILVIDSGKLLLDEPKEAALQTLSRGTAQQSQEQGVEKLADSEQVS
ncbi:type I secretion system permease/ATPase [Microbulbifer hydrolyticus]|uniref:ATP-binding cassette subfamily C protein LapB n=1 Tax=Microbulbifer hydrolyticus TaxID=48074 RepID=A0A6P1TAU4_9GAMM|nr:type I secretion system permease/ATPase [Microbulbifer hydrolyticus]MBB5210804.1 ATP-binding cassette subfamily C protein LapB [Microbulbifer hydrolyticus]QHQ38756.1 type I secretion system permease/ATPase [Microbulbifer hydrolyticus]